MSEKTKAARREMMAAEDAYRLATLAYADISKTEAIANLPSGAELYVLESRSDGSRWERGETSLDVMVAVPAGADLTAISELFHSFYGNNWNTVLASVGAYFWNGDDWVKAGA